MKILVACEESQIVTTAFRARGHQAWSCDIEPCSGGHPEWHLQCDVRMVLDEDWDMIIAFPPCTYLCASGMHWTTRGLRDPQLTIDAVEFAKLFWNHLCPKVVIENPVGRLSKELGKPTQIVQPWMFGDDASKKTCLWIRGLPELIPTKIIPPKGFQPIVYASQLPLCECCDEPFCTLHNEHYADCGCFGPTQDDVRYCIIDGVEFAASQTHIDKPIWGNQTPSGQNKLGPSPERAKLRSKTYPGIAEAMAQHWG